MQDVYKMRKEEYQAKLDSLNAKCKECFQQNDGIINYERCEMHCIIGFRIRSLETQYSDITGVSHDKW